jgi:hypothetical protein
MGGYPPPRLSTRSSGECYVQSRLEAIFFWGVPGCWIAGITARNAESGDMRERDA